MNQNSLGRGVLCATAVNMTGTTIMIYETYVFNKGGLITDQVINYTKHKKTPINSSCHGSEVSWLCL